MDGTADQGQDRRGRHEVEAVSRNAPEQSLHDDALLHPDLRVRPEDSLCAPETFLHRTPGLRAEHSRVLLSRDHHRGPGFHGPARLGSWNAAGTAYAAHVRAGLRPDF